MIFCHFAENGVKMYKNRYNERKILAVFSVDGKKESDIFFIREKQILKRGYAL